MSAIDGNSPAGISVVLSIWCVPVHAPVHANRPASPLAALRDALRFHRLSGGIASLNHRLIAWMPSASFLPLLIGVCAPPSAACNPTGKKKVILSSAADSIHVLIWDEQQPAQRKAYGDKMLGETIAAHLATKSGLSVRTAKLDDAEQGLGDSMINTADVLPSKAMSLVSKDGEPTNAKEAAAKKVGADALVAADCKDIRTPNLDRLAKQGAILECLDRK